MNYLIKAHLDWAMVWNSMNGKHDFKGLDLALLFQKLNASRPLGLRISSSGGLEIPASLVTQDYRHLQILGNALLGYDETQSFYSKDNNRAPSFRFNRVNVVVSLNRNSISPLFLAFEPSLVASILKP